MMDTRTCAAHKRRVAMLGALARDGRRSARLGDDRGRVMLSSMMSGDARQNILCRRKYFCKIFFVVAKKFWSREKYFVGDEKYFVSRKYFGRRRKSFCSSEKYFVVAKIFLSSRKIFCW